MKAGCQALVKPLPPGGGGLLAGLYQGLVPSHTAPARSAAGCRPARRPLLTCFSAPATRQIKHTTLPAIRNSCHGVLPTQRCPLPLPALSTARGKRQREGLQKACTRVVQKACSRSR